MGAFRRRLMFAKEKEPVNYLKFTALESGTITLSIGSNVTVANFEYAEYSIDDGVTWTKTDNVASTAVTITTPTLSTGDSVLWRGSGIMTGISSTSNTAANNSIFSSTCQCNVTGDIRTLLGLNKPNNLTIGTYIFKYLFRSMDKLIDASDLIMPSETNNYCFYGMFVSCTGLTKAPSLPAVSVANSSYMLMFSNCSSLTSVPDLPAETLGSNCYDSMFNACTSLVTAQATLPATTLKTYCYSGMFYDCSSLTKAPSLPATTLQSYCYSEMFRGCSSLTTPPSLSATTLANYCYYNMFYECTSLAIAPALPATTLKNYCYSHMFEGCESLVSVPSELPASTLISNCYEYMFRYCSSLAKAPELPAITLASYSYRYMFYGCGSLAKVKALFTTTPASSYTNSWMMNVKAGGIFIKNINATWDVSGGTGIPTTWTVIYYNPNDDKYYTDQQKTQECDEDGNPI